MEKNKILNRDENVAKRHARIKRYFLLEPLSLNSGQIFRLYKILIFS